MTGPGSRVLKWKHRAHEKLSLSEFELPIMAELFLRGAQTAGELRSRVARMRPFASLDALIEHVDELRNRGLVTLLAPTAGRRAQLYDHTIYLDDEKPDEEVDTLSLVGTQPAKSTPGNDRVKDLEEEVSRLRIRIQRIESALDLPSDDDDDDEQDA